MSSTTCKPRQCRKCWSKRRWRRPSSPRAGAAALPGRLPETGGGCLITHAALHGGARQSLVFLIDGESGAVHPLLFALLRLAQFPLQDVLIDRKSTRLN